MVNKIKDFWINFKTNKKMQVIIAVFVAILVCVVCFAGIKTKNDNLTENSTQTSSDNMEYVSDLENKLCNVLSKISGVGDVNVIITLKSGFSYEYASNSETKNIVSGDTQTTTTTTNIILVSGQPVVVKENYPVIKGVIVVAKGAEDIKVKMAILEAVETVLEIDQNEITVLA